VRAFTLFAAAAVAWGLLPGSAPLQAQSSLFGVRGLGLPGRELSARARATGGSFGLFDPESALNPASLAQVKRPVALFNAAPSRRHWETPAGSASLKESRFPLATLAGWIPHTPVSFGVSYASYTDQDFRLVSRDTITIRSQQVGVTDTLSSVGGLNQIRLAVAYDAPGGTALGASAHIITGSGRLGASRVFDDTTYSPIKQQAELSYAGVGVAVGVIQRVSPRLRVAALMRTDTRVRVRQDSLSATHDVDLPYTFGAGVMVQVSPKMTAAAQGIYRTWSGANSDLLAAGSIGAVNTIDLSAGVEYVRRPNRPTQNPIRLGIRYATLPFPLRAGDSAHEFLIAAGSGLRFAKDRAGIDLTLEQAWRSEGSDFRERAFTAVIGVSVRP
jgi:opacity protein-like surface antigen